MTAIRSHLVAVAAFESVSARTGESFKKQYGALTHKLPVLILQNGLAQASGFLLAKGENEHLAVLNDLLAVLRQGGSTNAADARSFHSEIIAADLSRTMQLTRHALDAAAWMKRYVQGELGITATGDTLAEARAEKSGEEGATEEAGQ
ncbi:type III-B CRISPR module-associated protein Cmr5 [Thiohalocapsa sp. ML1]|jgi:CRISPR-associated protein Cmr5|uniref:type III-B CRISPR module-associated protein Cmr5 n=1 Tax=Thiohalocapsa sp. ML1 TaxID=1431688 RepID=UPI0009EA1C76|nr:type III-B CRISPR module-associated protein Cmr5 [Thiohalocapsa sp. ML1]